MVPLRSTPVVAEQVPLAPSDLLRWRAVILHRRFGLHSVSVGAKHVPLAHSALPQTLFGTSPVF